MVDNSLDFYSSHTAQIEIVRPDRSIEEIVFPIPEICEYLTKESKVKVYLTAERDDQGSKVGIWVVRKGGGGGGKEEENEVERKSGEDERRKKSKRERRSLKRY